jgi:hypothetical protein
VRSAVYVSMYIGPSRSRLHTKQTTNPHNHITERLACLSSSSPSHSPSRYDAAAAAAAQAAAALRCVAGGDIRTHTAWLAAYAAAAAESQRTALRAATVAGALSRAPAPGSTSS